MLARVGYLVGQAARIDAMFTDQAGTPTDPVTVNFRVRDPAGVETDHLYGTDPNVTKDAVGAYHFTLPLTAAGKYTVRTKGTGSATWAEETDLTVSPSAFLTP